MRLKPTQLIVLLALLFGSSPLFSKVENNTDTIKYHISIENNNPSIAKVTASFIPLDNRLYMFSGANKLPRRWASFVSDISLETADGQEITLKENGDEWLIGKNVNSMVTLKYQLNLEHEKHQWSGGIDGAAYRKDWGVFYTSRALFIVNGINRTNIKVSFTLPQKWQVTTPWLSLGNNKFTISDQDALGTSMFFAGLHEEVSVKQDGFELIFAIGGQELIAQKEEFKNLAKGVFSYYTQLMGSAPKLANRAAKSVVIINPGSSTDGEAIGNNISILIDTKGGPMSKTISRFIFAHEFFHLWNGKSFAPNAYDTEWFKEGFSNYYTLKSLHHVGFLNDDSYLSLLANFFYQKYVTDDGVGKLSMTDGELKHEHWGLIYGGGFFVAIAQDMMIRESTNNEKSLDDLMRTFFNRYSDKDEGYNVTDIKTELSKLNLKSQNDFFKDYIIGVKKIPLQDYLLIAGVDTISNDGDFKFIKQISPNKKQIEIQEGFFGK